MNFEKGQNSTYNRGCLTKPSFINEDIEALSGKVTCTRSHSKLKKLTLEPHGATGLSGLH